MDALRRWSVGFLLACVVVVGASGGTLAEETGASGSSAQSPVVLDYRGKLQDDSGTPISGVFHLEFNIYEGPKSKKPIWTETQYLAVIDGSYKVPLGRQEKLPKKTLDGKRWIGIKLVDGAEILRDRLTIKESKISSRGSVGGADIQADTTKTKKLIKKARSSDNVAFADVARQAVRADRADVSKRAKKLGKSMTAKKVRELSEKAIKRLQEHRANPNAHDAAGSGLGDGRSVLESVGGPGGKSYEHTCPPGWVVVGITGGQGRVVDSLALICKPLE